MTVRITIAGVPEEVRDRLAAHAAHNRQSMQEFLRGELERIAAKPPIGVWLQEVQRRKEASEGNVTTAAILAARDADRK